MLSNRYYQINQSSEPKVIGVRNGVHQGEIIWSNFNSKTAEKDFLNNYFSLEKYKKNQINFLPEELRIEYVEAHKMAKMTDIFGFFPALYGIEYFISDKFKNVLKQFNLRYLQFIPVQIYQEGICFQYWAPYVSKHYTEESFDFKNSLFNEKNYGRINPKKNNIPINSIEDYLKKRFEIEPEVLFYNDKFEKDIDFFISLSCYGFVVSEQLKSALIEVKISGINVWDSNPKIFN